MILHSYINVAKNLGVKKIHLPLRLMNENAEKEFETVGVSVHSADEAVLAENGCNVCDGRSYFCDRLQKRS